MEAPHSLAPDAPARELALRWLAEPDHVWLRALIDEYERFVGRRRRELDQRLREPLPSPAPVSKLKLAIAVLDRLFGDHVQSAVPPPSARALLFGLAAAAPRGSPSDQEEVWTAAAKQLDVGRADLGEALFADVPGERRLTAPAGAVSPGEVALRANLLMVQKLLRRSFLVNVRLEGHARAIVRHAKWRGLICTVQPQAAFDPHEAGAHAESGAVLSISGPFSLFARTLVYGRALGELVPHLAWCTRYRLEARVELGGAVRRITVGTGDPIWPAHAPRAFDSRLEERFARDFRKAAPGFDVIREPEPVRADGTLIFPDFALVPRDRPSESWLLEIVGYWTRTYLARKLAKLRSAGLDRLILCVDEQRNCGSTELPPGATVIRYHRRIDPAAVLRAMGVEPASSVNASVAAGEGPEDSAPSTRARGAAAASRGARPRGSARPRPGRPPLRSRSAPGRPGA